MWYEIEPTARGSRYRYSVIFTNEDGGTPTDRLMATWGRTTDIEYLYSVEVDAAGKVLSEDMQGPNHEVLPFRGSRDRSHPQLVVATDNNMVLDKQPMTTPRYALVPVFFELRNVAREVVMDRNPWLYEVMAKELAREGKIVPHSPAGQDRIPDPRQFVYLEGCGVLGDSALSFSVQLNDAWIRSDRDMPEYRIARDGCFRAAVPLPSGATVRDARAIRVHAHNRRDKKQHGTVAFERLNALFGLDENYRPTPSAFSWTKSATIVADGPAFEIPIPR
jgi:hypothetical protein